MSSHSSEDTSKSESSPPNNRKEYNKEVSSSESDSDDEATGTIRCICNDDSDHGLMIQCEKCLVWQHSICVGIRGDKAVPKHYYCEVCQLRTFKCLCNKNDVTGKVIQCSQCNTWQHIRCLGRSTRALPKPYKCPSCDPSVLTTNSLSKKPKKKRKGSSEFDFISSPTLREEMEEDYFIIFTRNLTKPKPSRDFRTLYLSFRSLLEKYFVKLIDDSMDEKYEAKDIVKGISIILDAEPEAVSRCFTELVSFIQSPSSSSTPNVTAVDKMPDPNKGWSIIKDNVYPSKIKRPPLPKSEITSCAKDTTKLCNNEECQCRQHRHECTSSCACGCSKNESACRNRQIQSSKTVATSIAKFQSKWGLAINESVQTDEFICEYLGSVSEMESIDYRSLPLEERTFTLALPDLDICVDARKFGNSARFLRRSCKPNAEIRERFVNNQLRVGIFAKEDIPAESEITIDFDFPWKESVAKRECACGTSDCVVAAWAEHLKSAVKSVNNQLKALDLPMNGVEIAKRKPEPASPTEEPREVPMQDLDKLSREERKIALLMKTIQKMEDRQNRKRKYKDRDSQGNKIQKTGDDGSTSDTSSPPPVSVDSPMQISELSKESSISKSEVGDGAPPSNEGKDSLGKEKPLLASLPILKVESSSSKVPEKKETTPSSSSDQPVKRKGPGRPPKYPRPNGTTPSKAPTPTKSSTTNPIIKPAPKEPTKTEKSEKIEKEKPVSKPSTPKLEKAVVKPVTPKIEKPPVKVPEKPPPQLKKEELPKELNGRMKDDPKSSPNPKKKILRPNPLSNSRESISVPIKAATTTTTSITPKKETLPTPPQEDPMKSPHLKLGKKWILEYMNQTQEKQQPPAPPKSMETPPSSSSSEAIKPIKKKIFDSIKTQTIESEKNTQTNTPMETQTTQNVEASSSSMEMTSSNVQGIPKNGTHKDDPMDIDVRRVISEDQPSIYNGTLDSRERLIEANGSPHPSIQSNPLLGM